MGFSMAGGDGCCKIGRDERMRIILTWALVVSAHGTASATGERVGRGGSQALFPTSYLDPTPPKQLHTG